MLRALARRHRVRHNRRIFPGGAAAITHPDRTRVSVSFVVIYVLAQFGIWIALLTPVALTMALRVAEITTQEQKGRGLGAILASGALVALVVSPVWGALSDRTQSRMGRRRPWLLGGLVIGGLGLSILASAQDLWTLGIGWVLCQAGFGACNAASAALLPDVIPTAMQGRASGLLGLTSIAAIFVGTWLTQSTQGNAQLMFLAPFTITVVTVGTLTVVFREPVVPPLAPRSVSLRSLLSPFASRDFSWAFTSRFLIMMAWSFLLTYQVFFLTDHLHLERAETTSVMVRATGIMTVTTIIVSMVGGFLSDLLGRRKPFVFIAAAIEAAGFLLIASSGSVNQFLTGVSVASLGKGLYFAVDLALIAVILPDRNNTARDLATFMVANMLPQSVAPAIAPALLLIGAGGGANYPAVYGCAALMALLGALAIRPIRGVQ